MDFKGLLWTNSELPRTTMIILKLLTMRNQLKLPLYQGIKRSTWVNHGIPGYTMEYQGVVKKSTEYHAARDLRTNSPSFLLHFYHAFDLNNGKKLCPINIKLFGRFLTFWTTLVSNLQEKLIKFKYLVLFHRVKIELEWKNPANWHLFSISDPF